MLFVSQASERKACGHRRDREKPNARVCVRVLEGIFFFFQIKEFHLVSFLLSSFLPLPPSSQICLKRTQISFPTHRLT